MKKILSVLAISFLSFFILGACHTVSAAGWNNGGYYINLYGGVPSLNGVTTHTGQFCDTSRGECKWPNGGTGHVEEYVCTGEQLNCDNGHGAPVVGGYPQYSTDFWIIANTFANQCDYTIQLDVFNSAPAANANPVDFMTWYSGACTAPTPTQTPLPTPTPTPVIVYVTPTPTPTEVPVPTATPMLTPTPAPIGGANSMVSCPAGTSQYLSGSTVICMSQSANAQTGPITVTNTNNNNNVVNPAAPVVVNQSQPQVVYVSGATGVTTLPKTGMPVEAWGLTGFFPAGLWLKKFASSKKVLQGSANYLWHQRQFLKK